MSVVFMYLLLPHWVPLHDATGSHPLCHTLSGMSLMSEIVKGNFRS